MPGNYWLGSIGFVYSTRRRHTRCSLVSGVQTCALPISRVQAVDPVTDRVAGGEHEDGYVVARGSQRLRRLDPVQARHHHVHHHGVGTDAAASGQRLGAVGGHRDLEAVELERAAPRLTHRSEARRAGTEGVCTCYYRWLR